MKHPRNLQAGGEVGRVLKGQVDSTILRPLDADEEVCYSVSSIVQRCTDTKEVER